MARCKDPTVSNLKLKQLRTTPFKSVEIVNAELVIRELNTPGTRRRPKFK